MPKALSLKKASQTGPPKNQKAITQFFMKSNVAPTQNTQKSPVKSKFFQEKCIEKKPLKRKAVSLPQSETIEILDDECVSNGQSSNSVNNNVQHTPKKFKNDHIQQKSVKIGKKGSPSKISTIQISPEKENGIIRESPKKIDIGFSKKKGNIDKHANKTNDNENKIDRSPLTPVELDNTKLQECESDNVMSHNSIIETSPNKNENHVLNVMNSGTPKKVLQFQNHDGNNISSPAKLKRTPQKSPVKVHAELRRSPRIAKLQTPENINKVLSPSKSGSTIKSLDFSQYGTDDMFEDVWEIGDMEEEEVKEDLDLTTIQRCEVLSVIRHPTRLELRLKNASSRATCFVDGIWLDTALSPGEIISILATRDASGQFHVGNSSGLIALRPDHLVSSTSVVAGVFCKRKALLQERWRGIDSANTAMTIGILVHELVQKALTENIKDVARLRSEADKIVTESIQMLYDAGLSEEEARSNMQTYISPLAEFMQKYVGEKPTAVKAQRDQWSGHIDKVLDIEENMCCPQLGLKGKIDATLQVTIHDRKDRQKAVVPLELKSGKASVSAEHRGQLVLYGMMLSLQRGEDPARDQQRGLLLYLKDRVDLREVSCGYPERRDLVMLRNQLVQHLAVGPEDVDAEQLTDIEDAACLLQQRLPDPVHHETACAKCPYLTLCSLHLWHTDGPSVSESHPLAKLRDQALGHLSPEHVKYFLHWTALIKMEERGQMAVSPLHALWTDNIEKRAKRGTCAPNLKLKAVQPSGDRFLHMFQRQANNFENKNGESNKATGPQEGEFSIVSIEKRPWIAAGVVLVAKEKEISILLERDLSRRLSKDTLFHINTYESYATTVQNLTNLGVLLEDSDRALRLRNLIINKDTPEFEKKLPREVGRLGAKLMRSLNIEQQRAVLKALAAKDYALLQGLPGTGKTQTISVLIQMLVGLKQRVLVTAHTHSAVDTVLSRLPETLRVMRLGSSARVAPSLQNRCEQQLAATCTTTDQLAQLYDSMDVVGVTCLGANHAMLSRSTFDICIVDEATQVLQCTVLRPLFAAKRFVLVGDPEQLPPVVRSRAARRLGMEESLFHRLMNEDATSTLQLQYRMNQALADIANQVAYNSRLKCADQKVANARLDIDLKKLSRLSKPEWLLTACSPNKEHAALFIDIDLVDNGKTNEKGAKSCTNVDEACVVLALVDALIEGGVKPSEVGVIAPYRDQVSLLQPSLIRRGAEASTVDQFQGRDKAAIIYSCTKREQHDDRKVKEGEILNDQRRLAVSVTRAKHKLLVVGNSRALQRYAPLKQLIDACAPLPLDKEALISVVDKYRTEFA